MKIFIIMFLFAVPIMNAKQVHLFSCATLYNYSGNSIGEPIPTNKFNVHTDVFEVVELINYSDKLYYIIKYNEKKCAVNYHATVSDNVYNIVFNKKDVDHIQPVSQPKSYPDGKRRTIETQSESKSSISVPCSGTTKKGTRCKNKTNDRSGKCYLHK